MGTNSEVPKSGRSAIRQILDRLTVLERRPNNLPDISAFKNPDTLVVRNADGNVQTGTPLVPDDAVPLGFFDAAAALKLGAVNQVLYTPGLHTYTPPDALLYAIIETLSGGGAGGGRTTGAGTISVGGGGQAGGYKRIIMVRSAMTATVAIEVGAAGAGVSGANGGNGGNSSFGGYATCTGGQGGLTANGPNTGSLNADGGSTGGVVGGTVAGLSIAGAPGQDGRLPYNTGIGGSTLYSFGTPGDGGSCIYGQGGQNAGPGQSGLSRPGTGYGAGGTGIFGANQSAAAGANGAPGLVLITEFLAA